MLVKLLVDAVMCIYVELIENRYSVIIYVYLLTTFSSSSFGGELSSESVMSFSRDSKFSLVDLPINKREIEKRFIQESWAMKWTISFLSLDLNSRLRTDIISSKTSISVGNKARIYSPLMRSRN